MSETPTRNLIKVLVVDDSMFIRTAIKKMLEADAEIRVIGTASNGLEAIKQVKALKPDLVTMDIRMPQMDGLTALKKIMAENPVPILVISVLTESEGCATIEALNRGALDYIPKPLARSSLDILRIQKELHQKVKLLSCKVARTTPPFMRAKTAIKPPRGAYQPLETSGVATSPSVLKRRKGSDLHVVAIGTSTGGPRALQYIIPHLPADFPSAILIVQHMPAFFTKSLANRLDSLSQLRVKEAEAKEVVEAGKVLIAPGDQHMTVIKHANQHTIRLSQSPKNLYHKPSVDVMMSSVAEVYGSHAIGVILTGMGHDGLEGLTKIHRTQGLTLAQDEATSIIFGMPKACIEHGIVDQVLPLERIAQTLIQLVQRRSYAIGS